jgi:hypothetical protein
VAHVMYWEAGQEFIDDNIKYRRRMNYDTRRCMEQAFQQSVGWELGRENGYFRALLLALEFVHGILGSKFV